MEIVEILDTDIYGPIVPKLLGLIGQHVKSGAAGAFPVISLLGIRFVLIGFFLLEEQTPTIWQGPLKMSATRQFLSDAVWDEIDVLFIDMPPGTGDEPLSIVQLLPNIDGVVIVTMPSELFRAFVKKAIMFARREGMPIIGIVENMSGYVCPTCGGRIDIFKSGGEKEMAEEIGVPFIGDIPIDPKVSVDSDKGLVS